MKNVIRKSVSGIVAMVCMLLLSFTVFAVNETESNDSLELANVIKVNEVVTGTVDDDADFYKFTTNSDGYIVIEAYHNYDSIVQSVILYNSDGKKLNWLSFDTRSEKAPSMKIGLAKGTYCVEFFSDSFQKPKYNYSFKINFTASDCWEKEYNGNVTKATSIDIGKTYYGSFICSGLDDYDYYKFTITKDSWVSLTFNREYSVVSEYISIRTYDLSKEKTIESYTAESSSERLTERIYLTKGEYYIRAFGQVLDDVAPLYNFVLNYENADESRFTTTKATTQKNDLDKKANATETYSKSPIYDNTTNKVNDRTNITVSTEYKKEENYGFRDEFTTNNRDVTSKDTSSVMNQEKTKKDSDNRTEVKDYKLLFAIIIIVALLIYIIITRLNKKPFKR